MSCLRCSLITLKSKAACWMWWCLSFVNCLFKSLQLIEGRLFLNKPGLWEGIKERGGSEAFVIIISLFGLLGPSFIFRLCFLSLYCCILGISPQRRWVLRMLKFVKSPDECSSDKSLHCCPSPFDLTRVLQWQIHFRQTAGRVLATSNSRRVVKVCGLVRPALCLRCGWSSGRVHDNQVPLGHFYRWAERLLFRHKF